MASTVRLLQPGVARVWQQVLIVDVLVAAQVRGEVPLLHALLSAFWQGHSSLWQANTSTLASTGASLPC